MRLRAVTIRNFRVHEQCTVDFDDRLTVIGGPNESGKSTLVEAMHRGFFMRSKTTGAELEAMQSHHGGAPEVDIRFEAQGRHFRLRKTFRGQAGTMTLEEAGEPVRTGDLAEARLAELLGRTDMSRGWARDSWSHLWVWQGSSFADPSAGTNARADDLVHRFQQDGAAIVQLSSRDARLADGFAKRVGDLFTKKGAPKSDSTLARAIEEHEAARQRLSECEAAVDRLFEANARLVSARLELDEISRSLAAREHELREVRAHQRQLIDLENRAVLEERDATEQHRVLDALTSRETEITSLRLTVRALAESLSPAQHRMDQLRDQESAAFETQAQAVRELADAADLIRTARGREALARAFLTQYEVARDVQALDERARRARDASEAAARLQLALAAIPPVDGAICSALERSEQRVAVAAARLEAIATRVELVRADAPVRLGEAMLEIGSPQTIARATELHTGDGVMVRVIPGGGADLAGAETALADARRDLLEQRQEIGVESAASARDLLAQRTALSNDLQVQERLLEEMRAAEIDASRLALNARGTEVAAEIARRLDAGTVLAAPPALADADAMLTDIGRELGELETRQDLCVTQRDDAVARLDQAREVRVAHEASMADQQVQLQREQDRLASLIGVHGSDDDRAAKLAAATTAAHAASGMLAVTRAAISALDPETVTERLLMLERALDGLRERKSRAESEKLRAEFELRQDGSRNPHADLEFAAAGERDAAAFRDRVQLQADAIRELHALYTAEKRALSEQFSRPLCDRANRYLRLVLPDAGLHLQYDGGAFRNLGVERTESRTRIDFDALSTGAREQVATALRLGVAEVLASGHDGTLPIVFDDAFAYSDHERLRRLRQMLFRAAERGLQVIILSCNASDYDGLGSRITLSPVPAVRVTERTAEVESTLMPDEDGGPGRPVTSAVEGSDGTEDRTAFLAALREADGRAGNMALRSALGWDEARYLAVRSALVDRKLIALGKGRGGSVILT